jgi:hypothetical protein
VHFQVIVATNWRPLSCHVNVCYVVGHERQRSSLFQSIVSVLWAFIIFWCKDVICCIQQKGDSLLLTVCSCCLCEMPWNVRLDASFGGTRVWTRKGIRDKTGEVNITNAYIINNESFYWILNVYHPSLSLTLSLFTSFWKHKPTCEQFILFTMKDWKLLWSRLDSIYIDIICTDYDCISVTNKCITNISGSSNSYYWQKLPDPP